MIKVKKDWWKNFFNHIYLITDCRSVNNRLLTRREVDLLDKTLNLRKTDRILDLCGGQGRHSIELAKRGYHDLTVLDYSKYLINLGRRLTKEANLKINFCKADARSTRLKSNDYTAVIVMTNSFGYFPEENKNLQVLKEINRLLKAEGKLLLDLTSPVHIKNNLKPISWHRTGDVLVLRNREIKNDLVKAREIVISEKEGLLRDAFYCERVYSKTRIHQMLKNTGFKKIEIRDIRPLHNKKADYGFLTSRMIVTAEK